MPLCIPLLLWTLAKRNMNTYKKACLDDIDQLGRVFEIFKKKLAQWLVADNIFEIEKKVWIFDFVIECLSKVCYHIFQSAEEVMDYNISDVKVFFTRKGCYHITHTNVFELLSRRSTKKRFFFKTINSFYCNWDFFNV